MAWQLHYTSARNGPTGRSGFQYVATSPGLPAGWEAAAAPYLVYRPPPEGDLPEAFGYDVVDGHALLVHCRYTGRDYSGRHGNFFGQAVVAEPAELEGLRPIELWRSPLWSTDVGPSLDDLVPGEAFSPEALGDWLAGLSAYELLARLLDAVVEVLRRGHGRVVLVGADTAEVARWIAVVSYSLPTAEAARLSFVTYSADPEAAPYRLVGTTPGVWETAGGATPAFFLDTGRAPAAPPGRFGPAAAACWRALDFDGLDAIGEFALAYAETAGTEVAEGLDTAATLRTLHAPSPPVADEPQETPPYAWSPVPSPPEQAAASPRPLVEPHAWDALPPDRDGAGGTPDRRELAALGLGEIAAAVRLGTQVGAAGSAAWVARVRDAVAECVRKGEGDLGAALEAVPREARGPVAEGALLGLEAGGDERRSALTDQACDLLTDFLHDAAPADLASAGGLPGHGADTAGSRGAGRWAGRCPRACAAVLVSAGRRHPERRLAVTALLLEVAGAGSAGVAEAALQAVWGEAAQKRRRPGLWETLRGPGG